MHRYLIQCDLPSTSLVELIGKKSHDLLDVLSYIAA